MVEDRGRGVLDLVGGLQLQVYLGIDPIVNGVDIVVGHDPPRASRR